MSEGGEASEIGRLNAPYRREVVFENVLHESGMRLLRIRIREGRRFTILDIDDTTATAWADLMQQWVRGELPDSTSDKGEDT